MSSRFAITNGTIAGLKIVERYRIGDYRGSLERLFCGEELADAGWDQPVAQINRTVTSERGTVRGLHYQPPPHAEMKLVSCLRGSVFDVAVDLRRGSPTFLQWASVELSEENRRALLIPRGCAHGFQALASDIELLYVHSAAYCADAEGGLHPEDVALGIAWPLAVRGLSARDASHPLVTGDFEGLSV